MTDEVRVIESDSLWERFKTTFSKPAYIIAAVIVVLVLATIIAVIVILTTGSNESSGEVAIDYSKALIVSDERDLWALDLKSQEKTLITKTLKGVSAFDIYRKNTIFWREFGSNWINSLSSKYSNLTHAREWDPTAVSVDFVTGKLYVLDDLARKLIVYDVQSTNYGIAIADLKNPVGLALDPVHGVMFIAQKSDSIVKGFMDGTSLNKIVTSPSITSVTVDILAQRIYWSNAARIESSDYNGGNRLIVACVSGAALSLAVSGNRLFWTSSGTNTSNLRSLWSCTIPSGGACSEADFQRISFDDPRSIKVYIDDAVIASNPCEVANGGCEQLCLLSSESRRSCACFVGYRLREDSKSCEPVNEFILYARGDVVRGRILDRDREAFTDAIIPVKIRPMMLDDKETIDFDYNVFTNTIAYSDDRTIGVVNLLREEPQDAYDRGRCLKSVSFDWITNDVYYIRDNCQTVENTSIVVMKLKENAYFCKTLYTFSRDNVHPRSLAVLPNRDFYFFTVLLKGVTSIYRVRGLKITPFSSEQLSVNETGLAIDYAENRLFWFSQDTKRLNSANLEGGDLKSIDVSMIVEPRSVSIYDRHAYVANLTSIWRLDKLTGSGAVKLTPRFNENDETQRIAGVKIYSKAVQQISPDNPCAIQNGDCEQFCFRVPKILPNGPNKVKVTDQFQKKCFCEDYKNPMGDAKSCA